jgi:phosphoglycolate phosphatase
MELRFCNLNVGSFQVKEIFVKKPRAIIFDWDNTVVSSHGVLRSILKRTLDKLDIDHQVLESEQFRKNIHFSMREGFPRIFGEIWEEVREVYNEFFVDVHLDGIEIMPGARDALQHLRGEGVILAVVSNKDGKFVRLEAEKMGLMQHFHKIIGSQDAEIDKPSPKPAYMALSDHIVHDKFSNDIWFVGDSAVDLECGRNANCHPILFLSHPETAIREARADIQHSQVKNFDELIKLYGTSR